MLLKHALDIFFTGAGVMWSARFAGEKTEESRTGGSCENRTAFSFSADFEILRA